MEGVNVREGRVCSSASRHTHTAALSLPSTMELVELRRRRKQDVFSQEDSEFVSNDLESVLSSLMHYPLKATMLL